MSKQQPNKNTIDIQPLDLTSIARVAASTSTMPSVSEDGFNMFKNYANEYRERPSSASCTCVWVDDDVMDVLDKLRGVLGCPMKHLVSAAVRTFIEQNREGIKAAISSSKKRKSIL